VVEVLAKLAPLPMADGVYLMQEDMPDTYTEVELRTSRLDRRARHATGDGGRGDHAPQVRRVMETWKWEDTWAGLSDMAMSAARSGEPERAVKALLLDTVKNRTPERAQLSARKTDRLSAGNGGLLSALAMMANGWTETAQPTRPVSQDGKWRVRHEGLRTWL